VHLQLVQFDQEDPRAGVLTLFGELQELVFLPLAPLGGQVTGRQDNQQGRGFTQAVQDRRGQRHVTGQAGIHPDLGQVTAELAGQKDLEILDQGADPSGSCTGQGQIIHVGIAYEHVIFMSWNKGHLSFTPSRYESKYYGLT
jgi:hypothetical protein